MLHSALSIITVASLLLQRVTAQPALDPRAVVHQDLVAYIPPASNGGSQLDSSAGSGEPLNVSSPSQAPWRKPSELHFAPAADHHLRTIVSSSAHHSGSNPMGKVR